MVSIAAIEQNANVDIQTLYKTGTVLQQQGKIAAAIDSYRQAISCWKKKPDRAVLPYAANACSNWGCLLVQEGKFDEAIAVFEAGIAVAPDNAPLYNNLGIVLLELQKPEQAIALYRRAIELDSQLVIVRYNLGKAFQQLGLHTFASECFAWVISKQPDRGWAYTDLAVSLIARGKLAEAMLCFQKAIVQQNEFVEGFCRLVEMRLNWAAEINELDRVQIACVKFLRQLQQNLPKAIAATDFLGENTRSEDLKIALDRVTELSSSNPVYPRSLFVNFAEIYWHLGNVLAEYGGYEQAEIYYKKALQIQPKNPDIYLRLADCLRRQQRFAAAIVIYHLVREIAGDRADISAALQDVLKQQKLLHHPEVRQGLQRNPQVRQVRQELKCNPQVRQGINSLSHSESPLKRTAEPIDIFNSKVRQIINSPFDRENLLQTTEELISPLRRTFAMRQGFKPLPDRATTDRAADRVADCGGLDCQRCLRRIFQQFEPVHLGDGMHACRGKETAVAPPETSVTVLPNGRAWIVPQKNSWMICNAIAIIDENDRLIPELSREYPGELPGCENLHSTRHRFLNLQPEELPPLEQIDGTVAVLAGLSGNVYFHWMVDILPRIEILQRWGVNLEEIDWFLVNSYQQPFQRETLKALGIPEYKIIESDRHPYIQARKLIVPSFPGYLGWLSPQGLEFLRRVFLTGKPQQLQKAFANDRSEINGELCISTQEIEFLVDLPGEGNYFSKKNPVSDSPGASPVCPERIYISRSKCSYRQVINEEQVIEILSGFGFVSVLLESMTFQEQIALFARAKVIVAPHGSGLTNIIFCSPGTKVIELASPNYIRHYYWAIGQQLNLEHYYITGDSFDCYPIRQLMYQNPLTEDIWVNLIQFKKILGKMNLLTSKKLLNLKSTDNPKTPNKIMNQESADYFQKRAEFYLEQGKLGDAVTACEQALKHQPDFAPACNTFGKICQAQGNLSQAKQWYTKALELQPIFPEVYTNLSVLYAQEKNWEMALLCHQKLTTTTVPQNPENHHNKPQSILDLNPEDIEVYIQGAQAFYAQRKYEQAAAACQRVIQVKPDARVYKILGNARQAQGKIDEAKNCYGKAIDLDPDFAEAYTNLGTLYAQQQQWESAIAFYQKAIALQPNLASTYRNLARVRSQMGQLADADECWFKAYSLEPDKATPEEHINLGDNFLKQDRVTQAIRCYCHAIELNPNSNEAYQHLGNALKVQKRLQEEVANYRKIIERPTNIFGDFFKTVVVGLNAKPELPPQSQTPVFQGNSAANSLSSNPAIPAEKPRVQPQQAAVQQQLNSIARPANPAPAAADSIDVLSQVMSGNSGFTEDFQRLEALANSGFTEGFRQQETAETCIQRAENYCAQKQFERAIYECRRAVEIQPEAVVAWKLWGSILQDKGNLAGAIECYQKAVKLKTYDAQAQVNLGSLYALNKQIPQAISCYKKAVELQPNLPAAYRNLARVWTQEGKLQEANDCWYEAFSLEPEKVSPQQHFKLGNQLFKQSKFAQATACYQRAIELNPNFNAAYQNLAKSLKKQGKLDEAAVCLQKAAALNSNCLVSGSQAVDSVPAAVQAQGDLNTQKLEIEDTIAPAAPIDPTKNGHSKSAENLELSSLAIVPSKPLILVDSVSAESESVSAEEFIKQAEFDFARGKLEESIAACKRAIEIQPKAALAYKIMGNATQAMGKLDAARCWYAQALEIEPNFAEVHSNLGSLHAQQKQWQKSIACYQKAIEIKPDLASAYRNLARVLLHSGQQKAGAKYWYDALTLDINWAKPEEHFTLGNTMLELGELEKAISCYRRAIQLQPSYADACHNLGEVLSVRGELEEAISAYQQAIELNPNFAASHYSLGKVWANLERREEAIACFRRAIELNPDFAQAYQSLGDVLDSRGQIDEAIGCYEKTIELKPDIWEVHQKLGDALQEKGEIDGAIEAYNRAIELAKN
ncbi:MAG: tetratricopeptide repeat protein [Oscillatoriaceae cyanobacterium Prado104]|jgi:tetratricopeptide (TPR) repeat protein|nr:tetratricopeptide repeat protein [Oscillatoriaceae cyanobacterium Prado104]